MGFYGSNDPTNSVKALKEQEVHWTVYFECTVLSKRSSRTNSVCLLYC